MKKSVFCAVICLAMVFSFCACSASSEPSSESSSNDIQWELLESINMNDKEKLAFMIAKEITVAKMSGSTDLTAYSGENAATFFNQVYSEVLGILLTK